MQAGCAAGDPTSGLGALQAAGFGYSFVPNRPGFVCRISERPDPCNGAPATAYWSYWTAQPGGSWTYSNIGAGTRDPAPGNVDGWAFGSGVAPSVSPPAAAPPPTQPSVAPTVPPNQPPPAPAPPITEAAPVQLQPAPADTAAPTGPEPEARLAGGSQNVVTLPGVAAGAQSTVGAAVVSATTSVVSEPQVPALGSDVVDPESDPASTGLGPNDDASTDMALASVPGSDDEGGGSIGVVAGPVVVALVAAGALIARRRRRALAAGPREV